MLTLMALHTSKTMHFNKNSLLRCLSGLDKPILFAYNLSMWYWYREFDKYRIDHIEIEIDASLSIITNYNYNIQLNILRVFLSDIKWMSCVMI